MYKLPIIILQAEFSTDNLVKLNFVGPVAYIIDISLKSQFRQTDLNKHEKIHQEREKTFFCQFCKAGFFKKSYLKIHEQRHTGEKPFQCSFCPKKFILKTDRNSHERVHTGEKPYECELCKARFSSSSNLRRHEKGYCTMNPRKIKSVNLATNVTEAVKNEVAINVTVDSRNEPETAEIKVEFIE